MKRFFSVAILTAVILATGCQHEDAVAQDPGASASNAPQVTPEQKLALQKQVKQGKRGDN